MNRREFISSLAAGLVGPAFAAETGAAIGVLGPIAGVDLGVTLPHEHLLLDFSCRYVAAPDEASLGPQPNPADRWRLLARPAGYRVNLDGTSVESAIVESRYFQAAGGRTIVDLTGLGLGPDPRGLQRIARETGLNVIASTGFYIEGALPEWVRRASVAQLAGHLVDDIDTGGHEAIRRGAIGEIAVEGASEVELRCVEAAARAQRHTGAPCFLHVMSGILPQFRSVTERVLSIYESSGGDFRQLVLCHQDGSGTDLGYQVSLLDRGLLLAYDTFGSEGVFAFGDAYLQLPTDTQRIAEVAALVRAGHGGRVLISQDVCYQSAKRSWGGWGMAHILDTLRPRFAAAGVQPDVLRSIMTENPRQLLAFAQPSAARAH